jgi:hypothetical protein
MSNFMPITAFFHAKPKPKAAHKIAPAPPPIPEEVVECNEQLHAWGRRNSFHSRT